MIEAFQRRRLKFGALAVLCAAALLASGLELPVAHDVSVPLPGQGRIEIASVRIKATSLGIAAAQALDLEKGLNRIAEAVGAGSGVTLEGVTLDYGFAVFKIPMLQVAGSALSRAELLDVFDPNGTEPIAGRLARLSAGQVVIPELVVEQQVGAQRQVTRYRDIVGTDIVSGRIGAVVAQAASFETHGPAPDMTGTMGRLLIDSLDLAQTARVYTEQAGDAPSGLKRLYAGFVVDDLVVSAAKGTRVKVARVTGRDLSARPTKQSLFKVMEGLGRFESPEKRSPADQAKLITAFAELYEAMQIGLVEATGIEISTPDNKDQLNGGIARIAYTGATEGQPADLRIERLDLGSDKGKARIDLMAFTGFSFDSTLAGIRALGSRPQQDVDLAALRALIPTIGMIRFSGLDFDVPKDSSKGPTLKNIRFSLNSVEITADRPVNGIPTNLRLGMDGFRMPISTETTDEGLKEIAALGYRALDLSWLAAASWNEPDNELLVREVSVRGGDMGAAILRGTLGSVSKDVFNADSALAVVALLGATVKTADLVVENGGLFEKLIAQEARKQKKSPDELRREFGMAAAVAVPVMLGNSGSAKAIGQAVARFVAKPGNLSISARTKDPAGLGIGDLAALAEPGAVLGKLDVTATAE